MHPRFRALHLNMVRPIALGTLLGGVNIIVLAQLYALVAPDPQNAGFVIAYGAVPSIAFGAVFGVIAGGLRSRRPTTRMWLLCLLAFLGVVAVGVVMGFTHFIKPALLPTLGFTLLLERWTRRAAPAMEQWDVPTAYERKSDTYLAMFLGATTMLVTLVCTSLVTQHRALHELEAVFDLFVPFGLLIGIVLSLPFGALANATRTEPVWVRRLVLVVLASELVFVLGTLCDLVSVIAPAMIPTVAACLFLESRTRAEPALPPASIATR